jgi:hypothetical protein
MNDNFMYSLRKDPDPQFSARLKARLDEGARQPRAALLKPKLALGVCAALILALVTFTVSVPGVRAKLQDLAVKIGGQNFLISHELPDSSEAKIIIPTYIPIAEAAKNGIPLPAYLPEGFVPVDDSYVVFDPGPENDGGWTSVTWQGPDGQKIVMTFYKDTVSYLVGSDAIEEVLLKNNVPASLYQGGWYHDGRSHQQVWRTDLETFTLAFLKDGHSLQLMGRDPEELIRIAESFFP